MLTELDSDTDVERAVHDVRKRCKEVRSVARLVRPSLGDDFDRFHEAIRDASNTLAPIRDAHAMLATFDDLRVHTDRLDDTRLDPVRLPQAEAAAAASREVRERDERLERARTLLLAGRPCISSWNLPDGFDAFGAGLDRTYRRGRRALRRARAKPTDERMHEWRKAVKDLWYQTRLIELGAPSVLASAIANLDALAEALGDDHDLAVLVQRLGDDPDLFGGERLVGHARRLAQIQQDDLRRRAFRLGATIYAERPAAFRARMEWYWTCTVERGPELPTGGIAELAAERKRIGSTPPAHDPTHVVERERKFVAPQLPPTADPGVTLRQGYLAIDGEVSVRVRDAGPEGCTLTVKAGRGAVRTELEWPLTPSEFDSVWEQTQGRRVLKTRYRLPLDERQVEVDVFHEELEGLIIAEVEFDTDQSLAAFRVPDWFGPEVTQDERFTNASLATNAHAGPPAPRVA